MLPRAEWFTEDVSWVTNEGTAYVAGASSSINTRGFLPLRIALRQNAAGMSAFGGARVAGGGCLRDFSLAGFDCSS